MSKNLSQEQANMAVAVALQREVADLQRQLAEAKAEIEAMRPVVGAAINWKHNHSWDARERLFVCITDYEARKHP